jgi:hypothetical protein
MVDARPLAHRNLGEGRCRIAISIMNNKVTSSCSRPRVKLISRRRKGRRGTGRRKQSGVRAQARSRVFIRDLAIFRIGFLIVWIAGTGADRYLDCRSAML